MANVISNQDCDRALKQLAEGDITALSEIYNGTARLIFSLALSLLGNREDAEDVLQDTMLEVAKSAVNYKTGSPKAWVLSIARNRVMYSLRKRHPTSDGIEPSSLDPEFAKLEWLDVLKYGRLIMKSLKITLSLFMIIVIVLFSGLCRIGNRCCS